MLRFYARSSRETENCVSDLCVCRRHCSKSTWLFIRFVGSIAIGISRQILHIKTRRSGWNKFRNFAIRSSLYDARKSNLRVCMYEWNYIHIYIYIYIRSSQSLHVHAPFITYVSVAAYFADDW